MSNPDTLEDCFNVLLSRCPPNITRNLPAPVSVSEVEGSVGLYLAKP